jgi:hypothetical protein
MAWARDRRSTVKKAEADEGLTSVIDDGGRPSGYVALAVGRGGRARWRGREIVDPQWRRQRRMKD